MSAISHPEYFPWIIGGIILLLGLASLYLYRRAQAFRLLEENSPPKRYQSFVERCRGTAGEGVRWVALIIAIIASCGILLEYKFERRTTVPVLDGLEIAAMLDNSQSMLAPVGGDDLATSRLSVVISALDDALRSLNKDRWGLGGFSSILPSRRRSS